MIIFCLCLCTPGLALRPWSSTLAGPWGDSGLTDLHAVPRREASADGTGTKYEEEPSEKTVLGP